jgi:hypothetical protein
MAEERDERWKINLDSLSPIPQSTVYAQVQNRSIQVLKPLLDKDLKNPSHSQ